MIYDTFKWVTLQLQMNFQAENVKSSYSHTMKNPDPPLRERSLEAIKIYMQKFVC